MSCRRIQNLTVTCTHLSGLVLEAVAVDQLVDKLESLYRRLNEGKAQTLLFSERSGKVFQILRSPVSKGWKLHYAQELLLINTQHNNEIQSLQQQLAEKKQDFKRGRQQNKETHVLQRYCAALLL